MVKNFIIALLTLVPLFAPLSADEAPPVKAPVVAEQKTPLQRRSISNEQEASQKQSTPAEQSSPKEEATITDDTAGLPSPTPTSPMMHDNGYSKQFKGTLIAILIIIALVFLLIWLMKRFSNNRPLHMNHRKHIKILEKRPLSPNTYIYLLQVGDKQIVIAESKFQVQKVATLDWNETDPDR